MSALPTKEMMDAMAKQYRQCMETTGYDKEFCAAQDAWARRALDTTLHAAIKEKQQEQSSLFTFGIGAFLGWYFTAK
jgi:hypothetical protein